MEVVLVLFKIGFWTFAAVIMCRFYFQIKRLQSDTRRRLDGNRDLSKTVEVLHNRLNAMSKLLVNRSTPPHVITGDVLKASESTDAFGEPSQPPMDPVVENDSLAFPKPARPYIWDDDYKDREVTK